MALRYPSKILAAAPILLQALLLLLVQDGSGCPTDAPDLDSSGNNNHVASVGTKSGRAAAAAGEFHPDDKKPGKTLEEIIAQTRERQAVLDPIVATSGTWKYLIASEPQRTALTLQAGTPSELAQFEQDEQELKAAIYSDMETFKLYSDLHEFIEKEMLYFDHRERANNNRGYWTEENRLKTIRALDDKFSGLPAWERFWNYKFDKTLDFMENYG